MEEFGPLLWILIAGAGIAYSAATNAKKQAQKGKKLPHQEAWPTQTPPAVPHQPYSTDARRQTPAMSSQPNAFEPEPWSFDQEYEEGSVSEIQSLEVPAATSMTSTPSITSGSRPSLGSNIISERFAAQNQPAARSVQAPQSVAHTTDCEEETPSEVAEKFNLRKAVIYAEILKPKFEE